MMNIRELEQFLAEQSVDFEIIQHSKPIKSRFDALCYFKLREMAPTIIIKTDVGFYAVILSGISENVDFELIVKMLNCREATMATKEEVITQIGMKPGEVALVGHNLPCLIDEKIHLVEYIFGGTGSARHTLKIRPADLEKVNRVVGRFN